MASPDHHEALYAEISALVWAEMKRQRLSVRKTAQLCRVSPYFVQSMTKAKFRSFPKLLQVADGLGIPYRNPLYCEIRSNDHE